MMACLLLLLTAAQAYLLGSLDTGILVSRLVHHDDVRTHGSGAAGMTNMLRTFGKKSAAITAVGDVLKGAAAVCIGRWLVGHLAGGSFTAEFAACLGAYLAACFAILGHARPLYFGFKGGKGVLVAGGAILAIQPLLIPVLGVIFLCCLLPTGMVSLGSITMAAAYPFLTLAYGLLTHQPTPALVLSVCGAAIMGGAIIYLHRSNIRRIREGKEYRFAIGKYKNTKK